MIYYTIYTFLLQYTQTPKTEIKNCTFPQFKMCVYYYSRVSACIFCKIRIHYCFLGNNAVYYTCPVPLVTYCHDGSNRKQVQILCEHVTVNTIMLFCQDPLPQDRVRHWETGKVQKSGMSRDTCRAKGTDAASACGFGHVLTFYITF